MATSPREAPERSTNDDDNAATDDARDAAVSDDASDDEGDDEGDSPDEAPEVDPVVERRWTLRLTWISLAMAAVCLVWLVAMTRLYADSVRNRADAIVSRVQMEANGVSSALEAQTRATRETAERLAAADDDAITAKAVAAALDACADAVEITVVPTDEADEGLLARKGRDTTTIVEPLAGDALRKAVRAMAEIGWQPAVFAPAHKAVTASFIAQGPHRRVRVTLSLRRLRDVVLSARSGVAGFGFLIDGQGRVLVHPTRELEKAGKTLAQLSSRDGHHFLSGLKREQLTDEEGIVGDLAGDPEDVRAIRYKRVPGTDWYVGVVFDRREVSDEVEEGVTLTWTIVAAGLGIMLLYAAWILYGYHGNVWRLWAGTAGCAFALLVMIGLVWRLIISGQVASPMLFAEPITDEGTINDLSYEHTRASRRSGLQKPVFIPTGLFIQSLEFINANNISVRGYVWQRIPKDPKEDINLGVIFPEGNDIKFKESYRRETSREIIVGWQFGGVFRETFDYATYPFDTAIAWLRMWPVDFHKNVLLVPDLHGYDLLKPETMPGLERELVLSGWSRQASYFDYRRNSYNTNFGIPDFVGQVGFPELYFNVVLRRVFAKALVMDLIPIFVITCLLFALLVTTTSIKEKADVYGQKATSVLSTSAGLLFATILAHTKLRSEFAAQSGVIYLEFFYFALYLMLVLIPIHAFAVAAGTLPRPLRYRDGIIVKVLFWPVVLAFDMAVTLWYFL